MANSKDNELKNSIKQCLDLSDDYMVQVDKYIPIIEYMKHMDVSHYKVSQRKDKNNIPKDVYDIVFHNGNKVIDKRKGVKRGMSLCCKEFKKAKTWIYLQLLF